MILETIGQLFKPKKDPHHREPVSLKVDRISLKKESLPREKLIQREEAIATQIKTKFRPDMARYLDEMLPLIVATRDKFVSEEQREAILEGILDYIVGWSYPIRELFSPKVTRKLIEDLPVELVYDEQRFAASTRDNGFPTLKINVRGLIEGIEHHYFAVMTLKQGERVQRPMSQREWSRTGGVEEGAHNLEGFFKRSGARKKSDLKYRGVTRFNDENKPRFYLQPKERRADYWKARYARLFLDDESLPEEERLSTAFLLQSRDIKPATPSIEEPLIDMEDTAEFVIPLQDDVA